MSERDEDPADLSKWGEFHIVGVGASAGGLESLERLFTHLPTDTGMAFVVLQHLSPDFKSLMDELLGRRTAMRIRQAEHEMPVEPDTVPIGLENPAWLTATITRVCTGSNE